jgi:hypothetical protein
MVSGEKYTSDVTTSRYEQASYGIDYHMDGLRTGDEVLHQGIGGGCGSFASATAALLEKAGFKDVRIVDAVDQDVVKQSCDPNHLGAVEPNGHVFVAVKLNGQWLLINTTHNPMNFPLPGKSHYDALIGAATQNAEMGYLFTLEDEVNDHTLLEQCLKAPVSIPGETPAASCAQVLTQLKMVESSRNVYLGFLTPSEREKIQKLAQHYSKFYIHQTSFEERQRLGNEFHAEITRRADELGKAMPEAANVQLDLSDFDMTPISNPDTLSKIPDFQSLPTWMHDMQVIRSQNPDDLCLTTMEDKVEQIRQKMCGK